MMRCRGCSWFLPYAVHLALGHFIHLVIGFCQERRTVRKIPDHKKVKNRSRITHPSSIKKPSFLIFVIFLFACGRSPVSVGSEPKQFFSPALAHFQLVVTISSKPSSQSLLIRERLRFLRQSTCSRRRQRKAVSQPQISRRQVGVAQR